MSEPFDSYAQNGEDVVLWRALGHLAGGRYVEVGVNDPVHESVTWAFYQRGWRGIAAEPVPELAERFRQARPEDLLVRAAITDKSSDAVVLHQIAESGLSTLDGGVSARHAGNGWPVTEIEVPARTLDDVLSDAGWDGLDIHFMVVDAEGSEAAVLTGIDLRRWRPWVVVVEATEPTTSVPSHHCWEPGLLRSGYQYTMFDGLSRYYVADEHADELAGSLRAPASVMDTFTTEAQRAQQAALAAAEATRAALDAEIDLLRGDVARWRAVAVDNWADAVASWSDHAELAAQQVRMHNLQQQFGLLSRIHHELSGSHHELSGSHHELSVSHHQLFLDHQHLASTIGANLRELAAVRHTASWRITRPFRLIKGWLIRRPR